MTTIVGLTGNIGSGKTTICKVFSILNIPIFYADTVAKDLLDTNKIKDKLIETFGINILNNENNIDKIKLANLVFSEPELLSKLNSIIHPEVYNLFQLWIQQHKDAPYALIEAAILFESNFDKYVDLSINVHCDKEIRLKRVINRDKTDEQSVINRMNKQLSDEEKLNLSDYSINNNEDELVIPQVLNIHKKILESLK